MKQGHGHTGPRNLGPDELKWQVRINLSEEFAAAARANPADPSLKPLQDVLTKYDAVLKQTGMNFADFLPHFEQEEQPEFRKKIDGARKAIDDALKAIDEAGGDVNAGTEAMKAFDAASAEYGAASAEYVERLRLYLWTKDTLQKPETQKKYATRFTIYADGGREVYGKDVADGLEADLQTLVKSGMVVKINKFDSDPAHNPQAPQKFHR